MKIIWTGVLAVMVCFMAPGVAADEMVAVSQGDEVRRIVVDRNGVVQIDTDDLRLDVQKRGFLGVRLIPLSSELKEYFRTNGRGVMVSSVVDGSAAEKAGLKAGDIIVEIDGKTVKQQGDLSRGLRDLKEGQVIEVRYVRDGVEGYTTAIPEIREHGFHRMSLEGPLKDLEKRRKIIGRSFEDLELEGEALEKLERELGRELEIDLEKFGEDVEESMRKVRVYFDSPEWKERMGSLGECAATQAEVEALTKRVRDLERKLKER